MVITKIMEDILMIMKLIGIWMIIHEDKNKNIDDEDDEDNNSADEQLPSLGASTPPEAMMHFPLFPISSLFPKKISDFLENFPNVTFSDKISRFSSVKISDDLLLVMTSLQIWNFPTYFRYFIAFPLHISEKIDFPLLLKISPMIS